MVQKKKIDWGKILFEGFLIGFVGIFLSAVFMYIIDAFFRNAGEFFNIGFSIYLSHFAMWVIYKREEEKNKNV